MTTGLRIIDGAHPLGTRCLIVDGQGRGDFELIQEAINYAKDYSSILERWTILISPGFYEESLVLYDYVDLIAIGWMTSVIVGVNDIAITSNANCVISGVGFYGSITCDQDCETVFHGLYMSTDTEDFNISITDGTVKILNSFVQLSQGSILVDGGSLEIGYSYIKVYANSGSGHRCLVVTSGEIEINHSKILNKGLDGPAIYIAGTMDKIQFTHSVFIGPGSYCIEAATNQTNVVIGCCCANEYTDSNSDGADQDLVVVEDLI